MKKLGLNDRQVDAILFYREKGEITGSEYAEHYKITDRTARNDLNELVENKLLTKQGETNQSKYIYI
jgi:ATP-dependent DNA helicase RecG